jgi:hypothetical protein
MVDPRQRRSIPKRVLNQLYADFGGQCAISNCPYPNRLSDGTPILEVAHIVSLNPGGIRSDPSFTFEDANRPSNLILLCPLHHRMIDDQPSDYPAQRLRAIRDRHVKQVAASLTQVIQPVVEPSAVGSRFKQCLGIWERERLNGSEEFWQTTFRKHPELLISAAGGRAFVLESKCYVGGKAITNRGGNILDFLVQHSGDVVLVEIKTPLTKLLGTEYRSVYPPSHEVVGAITQALNYRFNLLVELRSLQFYSPGLIVNSPSILVLTGDAEGEGWSEAQRRSFELFRGSIKDVAIQTYDELFAGVGTLAAWMEAPASG